MRNQGTTPLGTMIPPVWSPGFGLLVAAGIASVAGFSAAQVCLVWIVYSTTHSPIDVAFLGVSGALSAVAFSLVAGGLADRYDRRRLMVVSDLARAAALAVLVGVLAERGFDLYVVLAVNFVVASFSTMFQPAEQTFIPRLVAPGGLARANGIVNVSRSTAGFVGVSVGGAFVVAVGPLAGISVTVGTFLLSAALLLRIVVDEAVSVPVHRTGSVVVFLREVRTGVVWLRTHAAWLQLTLSATFFNFFSTVCQAFLVVYATQALHGSALVFSGLLAASIAGLGVGSLSVGRIGAVRRAGLAWVLPYGAVSGALLVSLALATNVPVAVGLVALLGFVAGLAGTSWLTAAQLLVPAEVQGRYFGIDNLGSSAIVPVAEIVGGVMVAALGPATTYLYCGVGWTIAGALFLLPRSLRRLGVPDDRLDRAGSGVADPHVGPAPRPGPRRQAPR